MNYYILTSEVFESLDKDQIRYAHKSQDRTKWIEPVWNGEEGLFGGKNLSVYTFDNHSDWTGDGGGIDVDDIEETEYLSGFNFYIYVYPINK